MLQRTLIRHAITRLLWEDPALQEKLQGRIFANRAEPWLAGSLPAMGVYALKEEPVDEDISPSRNRRKLEIILEVITHFDENADDFLDDVFANIERVMQFEAIGKAMDNLVAGSNTLVNMSEPSFDLQLAETDSSITEVGAVIYSLEFLQPDPAPLPATGNFETGHSHINSDKGQIIAEVHLPGPFPAPFGVNRSNEDSTDES